MLPSLQDSFFALNTTKQLYGRACRLGTAG